MDNQIPVTDEQKYEITLDDIVDLMSKTYTLFYVNYDDNLDESLETVQEAIQNQDWQPLDEIFESWNMLDAEWNSIDYILKELQNDIERRFDIEDDEAETLIETYKEELVEIIRDRDDSDFLKDLLRQTSNPVMFYETGLDVEFDVPFGTEKDLKECLKEIKKTLKIKLSNTTWDDDLEMMIQQGYSGHLVVYFTDDIRDYLMIDNKMTHISFKNPHVAIINNYNGSGDHCYLQGHEFSMPLNTKDIWLDKCVKYSYTYDVCGMYSNWCDNTIVNFLKKRISKPIVESNNSKTLREQQEKDRKYQSVYDSGKCTFGDMKYSRHRRLVYRNDFPCGSKCQDCGTFFID